MALSGYQLLLGGMIMIVAGLLTGGQLHPQSWTAFPVLGYLAFLSAAAYSIWGLLLQHNPVSRVAIFGFLNPICGVGLSAVLLRESCDLPGKLILEIEKPDDAKTQRRLRFYEREGLTLAPFGYDAPGYQAGPGDCALQLMSEGAMSMLEFARHCAFLQEVVLDCTAGGAKPLCIWKE